MGSGLIGSLIFFAADVAIAVIILAMFGKLPVAHIVAWAKAHRWI